MLLVVGLQTAQDLDRLFHRRLVDVDLLEAPDQGPVLLEVVPVFLVGGRADTAQRAALQSRLQEIRGIHGAARGRAGADHGMDFVDEENGVRLRLQLRHHGLQALLEVAAIAGAGQQGAHVEAVDSGAFQHLRHFAAHDAPRQALGDRGLADPGLADIERVVLGAPAQNLDRAIDFLAAADQRIDLAVGRLFVEIDAIGIERLMALAHHLLGGRVVVGAMHGLVLALTLDLGDAVTDVVDRVEPAHLLAL